MVQLLEFSLNEARKSHDAGDTAKFQQYKALTEEFIKLSLPTLRMNFRLADYLDCLEMPASELENYDWKKHVANENSTIQKALNEAKRSLGVKP